MTNLHAVPLTETRTVFADDDERLRSFAQAIDTLRDELSKSAGLDDVAYIRSVQTASSALEVTGRALIHFSLEPVSFGVGVLALSAHKCLELMELGHTALHGTYDKLPESDGLHSQTFRWKAPIDEESWRTAHNIRHHQYTNVAGRDPDLDFGGLRLSERVPHRALHRLQPVTNVLSWMAFATAINLHVTGMLDVYFGRGEPQVFAERNARSFSEAHVRFLRKAVPYYAREYLFFPALAGPFFWKTLLGNALSELFRDVYAGATIYCGHVGADDYPEGARAGSRGAFYAMQVEGAWDIDVPPLLSLLCGGLDLQIEHHLFPRTAPNRLREVAPRVRQACERHGVRYRHDRWPPRLRKVLSTLGELRKPRREAAAEASAT